MHIADCCGWCFVFWFIKLKHCKLIIISQQHVKHLYESMLNREYFIMLNISSKVDNKKIQVLHYYAPLKTPETVKRDEAILLNNIPKCSTVVGKYSRSAWRRIIFKNNNTNEFSTQSMNPNCGSKWKQKEGWTWALLLQKQHKVFRLDCQQQIVRMEVCWI